jgi:hypothetical protein
MEYSAMSKYGANHSLLGYDDFRTGLTYRDVWQMLYDESDDSANWKYKRRGTVLGMWHELKLQMYAQAIDAGLLDS